MNLLIIDDDSISSFVNTRVAEKSGLFREIRSVSCVKDALEIFIGVSHGTVVPPDVVLLDLHMPGMSGFDFIEALKGFSYPEKERLHIVILTSSDHRDDMEKARAMGIQHYLVKSSALKDLQATIFSLCNKAQNLFREESNNATRAAPSF